MSTPLPRRTPADVGLSSRSVLDLLDAIDTGPLEVHSLMVLRHGAVAVEGWWAPYTAARPHLLYSLSKSVTSLAVGLAIDEGRAALDDRLLDHLGDTAPDPVGTGADPVTIRHALTMTTGHTVDPIFPLLGWAAEHRGEDWLTGFFGLPVDGTPGDLFTYNQLATYALGRIVTARSGDRLLDYLRPRLFDPLGITEARWLTDGRHDWAFSGLHLTTESIAKLGLLCRQRGRWNDQVVVPEAWIDAATTAQVANDLAHRAPGDQDAPPDWVTGYGYQFWISRHGYRGDGALGQFCLVWPEEEAVVVTTASVLDMQALLDLLVDHLRPGLAGPATPGDDAALGDRLAGLTLTPPADHPGPDLPAGPYQPAGEGAARRWRSATLRPDGDDWALDVALTTGEATVAVGRGRWRAGSWPSTPAMPVAAAGGRDAAGRFHLDLVFTETPHHLLVEFDPTAGTFTPRWNQFPLHGADPGDFAVA